MRLDIKNVITIMVVFFPLAGWLGGLEVTDWMIAWGGGALGSLYGGKKKP